MKQQVGLRKGNIYTETTLANWMETDAYSHRGNILEGRVGYHKVRHNTLLNLCTEIISKTSLQPLVQYLAY